MSGNELFKFLNEHGYHHLRQLPDGRVIGIMPMMFTIGLFYGIDGGGYTGRYCYPMGTINAVKKVMEAADNWDGTGDPSGEWIKHKGRSGNRSRLPDPITGKYED